MSRLTERFVGKSGDATCVRLNPECHRSVPQGMNPARYSGMLPLLRRAPQALRLAATSSTPVQRVLLTRSFCQDLRAEGADNVIRCRRWDHKADVRPGQHVIRKEGQAISPMPIHIWPSASARPTRRGAIRHVHRSPRATFFITRVTMTSPAVPAKTTTVKRSAVPTFNPLSPYQEAFGPRA
jgi:hypothetical protein